MSAALTREQTDLRDAVTDLMTKRSPESEVRRLMAGEPGYDSAVWAEMADMGLLGLVVPEQFGGSGADAADLAVVAEQTGRSLLCAPFLSTAVLVPHLLLALSDTAESADVLPRIAAGELIATVAFAEAGSARPPEHPATIATETPDGWKLTGEKTYVLDGSLASRIYVQAESGSCLLYTSDAADE